MGRPKGRKLTIFVDYGSFISPSSIFLTISIISKYLPTPGLDSPPPTATDLIFPFSLGGARKTVVNPYMPRPKWKEAFSAQDSDMIDRLLGLKVVLPKELPVSSFYRVRVAT